MPDSEATRKLAEEVGRLADGRGEITEALAGVQIAMEKLRAQLAAEMAAQTRGTRRRLWLAIVVVVLMLAGVASTGWALVVRAQDRAATSAQFDALARERVSNCEISRVRTDAQIALARGQLSADRSSLALLTGPAVSENAKAFAHTVFDGRITAGEDFLRRFPTAPLTCTVPER